MWVLQRHRLGSDFGPVSFDVANILFMVIVIIPGLILHILCVEQ